MGTVFRTLFFCFVMACVFSFVTLDTHCPSTGHRRALVFVVWVEKGLDICNKKLVVQQTSGKEFYWSMGSSSGHGPLDGWEFSSADYYYYYYDDVVLFIHSFWVYLRLSRLYYLSTQKSQVSYDLSMLL